MQACVCVCFLHQKMIHSKRKTSLPLGFYTDCFCIFSATGLNCHCLALENKVVYFLLHESL